MGDEPQEKPEAEKKVIDFGFKQEEDGIWLSIKMPVEMGMWNILGALVEAQTRVMSYFGQMAKAQEERKQKLVRPGESRFSRRWQ